MLLLPHSCPEHANSEFSQAVYTLVLVAELHLHATHGYVIDVAVIRRPDHCVCPRPRKAMIHCRVWKGKEKCVSVPILTSVLHLARVYERLNSLNALRPALGPVKHPQPTPRHIFEQLQPEFLNLLLTQTPATSSPFSMLSAQP